MLMEWNKCINPFVSNICEFLLVGIANKRHNSKTKSAKWGNQKSSTDIKEKISSKYLPPRPFLVRNRWPAWPFDMDVRGLSDCDSDCVVCICVCLGDVPRSIWRILSTQPMTRIWKRDSRNDEDRHSKSETYTRFPSTETGTRSVTPLWVSGTSHQTEISNLPRNLPWNNNFDIAFLMDFQRNSSPCEIHRKYRG